MAAGCNMNGDVHDVVNNIVGKVAEQLDALEAAMNIEKEQYLRMKMNEIIPFIEEELATRSWFHKGGAIIRLRYDNQLKQALACPLPY